MLFPQRIAIQVDLNAPGAVLQCRKTRFTHHALEHHAPSYACGVCGGSQGSLILFAVALVQWLGAIGWHEVIRKRNATRTHGGKLAPAFGDQVVFVLLWGLVISHD